MTVVPKVELEALLKEVEEIRSAIEATRGAIYTAFGVVLPGVVGLFLFTVDRADLSLIDEPTLALAFVVLVCLGVMWTQNLWMELLRYVRYYYVELMPRVYAASGQTGRMNFLEWSGPRSLRSWLPIHLFNAGALAVLVGVYVRFVWPACCIGLDLVAWGFIAAAVISCLAVMVEVSTLEREFRARRDRSGAHGASQQP